MTTPELQLETMFVFDAEGRIVATREPGGTRGPLFALIRGVRSCAWAVRADVSKIVANELVRVAREESPSSDFQGAPVHAERYLALLRASCPLGRDAVWGGPACSFPESITEPEGVVRIEDEQLLDRHFRGWVPGEIAAGRGPVLAIVDDGAPVSVCFCARLSERAAEAGLETAAAYRGRGLAERVTAAWALAIRASGRIPLYSTLWANAASRAVIRKLSLTTYASNWSISD